MLPKYDKQQPRYMQEGRERAHIGTEVYRYAVRPVAEQASSVIALDAYLIDSANPDTELKLDANYPAGFEFGKDYATDRKKEIVFKLRPSADQEQNHLYTYWLALRATIEVVNRGLEDADLTGALHMLRLDSISYKWDVLPVTWANRESWWTTEETHGGIREFNDFCVFHEAGGGYTDYDEYYPYPTSIAPGGKYTYTDELTYAFSQDVAALADEKQYWNNVTYDHDDFSGTPLPEIGWALKWSKSHRWRVPGEDEHGNPIQITDQFMDINCKFYGYQFYISGAPYG